jgi:hypothetical protein
MSRQQQLMTFSQYKETRKIILSTYDEKDLKYMVAVSNVDNYEIIRNLNMMNKDAMIQRLIDQDYKSYMYEMYKQGKNQPQSVTLEPEIIDEEVTEETSMFECKICTVNKICMVLPKCGHTFCYKCTTRFENKCAICRTPFKNEDKIHMFM